MVRVSVSFVVCVQARLRSPVCSSKLDRSACRRGIRRSLSSVLPLRRTGRMAGSDGLTVFVLRRACAKVRYACGSGIGVGTGAGVQYAGPRASPLACGSQGPQVRARLVHLPGLLSVAAPYRQVVGRGDFVERHACRRLASGPSDRNRLVGCTFVDFACSSGSASQLGSSRMEEELVLAVVALSYMQAFECAGRLRHVRRLRGFRQPNGSSTQHE